jgi:hypothetical protein
LVRYIALPDCPHIAGRDRSYRVEPGRHLRAWENTPTAAVPAPDQRQTGAIADRPGIPRRHCCHSIRSALGLNTKAEDFAPTVPIPVLDQRARLECKRVPRPAHGPDVIRARRGYSAQEIVALGIGAGDHAPTRAVPVLDQGRKPRCSIAPVFHCPHVVRTERHNGVELVVRSWHIRAWNHLPTRTVPVLDEVWANSPRW